MLIVRRDHDQFIEAKIEIKHGEAVVVGRGKSGLLPVTDDKRVSRRHARFDRSQQSGAVSVTALSPKGIVIRRRDEAQPLSLAEGDSAALHSGDGVVLVANIGQPTILFQDDLRIALITKLLASAHLARWSTALARLGCRATAWNAAARAKSQAYAMMKPGSSGGGGGGGKGKKRQREGESGGTASISPPQPPDMPALDAFTHIVVGNAATPADIAEALGMQPGSEPPATTAVVRQEWLEACLKAKRIVDSAPFGLSAQLAPEPPLDAAAAAAAAGGSANEDNDLAEFQNVPKYACQRPSPMDHPNLHLTGPLDELAAFYKCRVPDDNNDKRALSVTQASSVLKSLSRRLETMEQLKALESANCGIGGTTVGVIDQLMRKGTAERLEAAREDPKWVAIKDLCTVHGVGPKLAATWYAAGATSVMKARELFLQGKLPQAKAQETVLRWHEDLRTPISRAEAEAIYARVHAHALAAAAELEPDAVLYSELTGGYKRGKLFGHDADVIVSLRGAPGPDGTPAKHHPNYRIFRETIEERMTASGLLAFKLHTGKFSVRKSDDAPRFDKIETVMGIVEHEGRKRRVDVVVVQPEQFAFADLGWTGNTLFERHIRRYAEMEKNLKFSQLGLSHRGSEKIVKECTDGSFKTDRDIFRYLGLEYIPPHLRHA